MKEDLSDNEIGSTTSESDVKFEKFNLGEMELYGVFRKNSISGNFELQETCSAHRFSQESTGQTLWLKEYIKIGNYNIRVSAGNYPATTISIQDFAEFSKVLETFSE